MSNKETKTRVANAFRAMKALGISEDKVKPVLKSLLKLYDKNWTLIEEENYRALADAIFERDELEQEERSKKVVNSEAAEQSKNIVATQTKDNLDEEDQTTERPLKRLRCRHRDGQTSSLNTSTDNLPVTPLIIPKEEPDELQETNVSRLNGSKGIAESQPKAQNVMVESQAVTHQSLGINKGKQPVSPKSSTITERCDPSQLSSISRIQPKSRLRTESRSNSHPMRLRDRGKAAVSLQNPSREKEPVSDNSAPAACLKEPKIEPGILLSPENKRTASHALIKPKDEPITDDIPCLEVPGVICHSDTSNGGDSSSRHGLLRENYSPEPSALQPVSEKETADGTATLNEPRSNGELPLISDTPSGGDSLDRHGMLMENHRPAPSALQSVNERETADGTATLNEPRNSDTSNGGDSLSRHGMLLALQSISEKETVGGTASLNEPRNNGELPMILGECSSKLEIASSHFGEVKITLSCDLPPGRPECHMPSLETVLKCVDDKCLSLSKTLDPNISTMSLMKEICECFLKLGTDSNSQSPKTMDMHLTIDSASKSSKMDAPDAGGLCTSSLNGLVDSQSGAKLPETQSPRHNPPCNGINNGSHLYDMDSVDEIVTHRDNKRKHTDEKNALSLKGIQQPQVTLEVIKSLDDVFDIAKGQEKVVITLVNEVNDELPPSFFYIPQNAAFQNAYVNFSLARIGDNNCCATCSGDCLSSATSCACAHETGGEFAYTTDGLVKEELLKECISMNRDPTKHCQFFCKECPLERSKCEDIIEPCKGHLVRKFIKECWWKCGCNKQCGNRVVQRGISRNLQVFMTPEGKGWGLRTLEDLPKGAFVCEYVGEVLTNAELFERVLRSPEGEKHSYPVLLDADWCAEGVLKDEEALCLDATYYGNVARFINHRCYDSNLVEIPVEVETPDHHYYHLAFFTTRKVKAMEELTWDYGIDFDDQEHPIKAFRCQCGSRFCRNIKRYRSRGSRR